MLLEKSSCGPLLFFLPAALPGEQTASVRLHVIDRRALSSVWIGSDLKQALPFLTVPCPLISQLSAESGWEGHGAKQPVGREQRVMHLRSKCYPVCGLMSSSEGERGRQGLEGAHISLNGEKTQPWAPACVCSQILVCLASARALNGPTQAAACQRTKSNLSHTTLIPLNSDWAPCDRCVSSLVAS